MFCTECTHGISRRIIPTSVENWSYDSLYALQAMQGCDLHNSLLVLLMVLGPEEMKFQIQQLNLHRVPLLQKWRFTMRSTSYIKKPYNFKEWKWVTENYWKTIALCWVNNYVATKAAKHTLGLPVTEVEPHYEDYELHTNNYMDRLWEMKWDMCTENEMCKVQTLFRDCRLPGNLSWLE